MQDLSPIKVACDGVILAIRLNPSASRNALGKCELHGDGSMRLKVSVTVVPEKGKANNALIKLLAKNWRLPKSSFEIIAGETSRNKVLKISGHAENLKQLIQADFADNKRI